MCGLTLWLQFIDAPVTWQGCQELLPEVLVNIDAFEAAAAVLPRRGPDGLGSESESLADGVLLQMHASVLHMRGEEMTRQPHRVGVDGSLLFNGEIYSVSEGESDTRWLADRFAVAAGNSGNWESWAEDVRAVLEECHGPFALALWSPARRCLLACRDKLGRRSLLAARAACGSMCLSSTAGSHPELWQELPVTGVFLLDLSDAARPFVRHLPWLHSVPFSQSWWWTSPELPGSSQVELLEEFEAALKAAVRTRVAAQQQVGLLFSGGLDSTLLAALAAESLPEGQTIELLNVSFHKAAPDRLTALCSYRDLLARFGPNRFRLLLCDVEPEEVKTEELAICRLLGPKATHLDFNIAAALWFAARGIGLDCSPEFHQTTWWREMMEDEGSLQAVRLDGRHMEAAHQEPSEPVKVPCSSCVLPAKPGCVNSACKLCCRKLQASLGNTPPKCPVHKTKAGGSENLPSSIAFPESMDLSAQRCAQLHSAVRCSAARLLLVGTGADELLGGYGRHRTARVKRGAEGARSEMMKDLERLWTRNLGRDDRIIADHSREARHPFLDDGVLRFVGRLPIGLLAFGPGGSSDPSPDKWLLRELATRRGLHFCAGFKKRAIQFGSRIAKQSNVWHTGSNRVSGDMAYRPLAYDVDE